MIKTLAARPREECQHVEINADDLSQNPEDQRRAEILTQISLLESSQTPRRLREYSLGIDDGWLTNLENQIITLRSQL